MASQEMLRARHITWEDPAIPAKAALQMSGLEFLQAILKAEIPAPPIALLLGMEPVHVESGRVAFAMTPGEHLYNPIGGVHGGVISTILDTVMACAIHSTLPGGVGYTTVELHVNLLRPVTIATGRVRGEGEVIHTGRTVATAQGKLLDETGKLYAHATTTCMILRRDGENGK